MNFFTAEILLSVNAAKLAQQLKRAESASAKSARSMQSSMNKSFTKSMNDKIRATNIHVRMEKLKKKEAERSAKAIARAHVKAAKHMQRDAERAAKAMARAHKQAVMKIKRVFKNMGAAVGRVFRRLAQTVKRYAKYAIASVIAIGVACTKMAMDAEESENLFVESMGKMADAARKWSEEISDALMINAYEIRKNVGTFNVMFESMGMGTQAAYDMATGLTQLSYDMASFYNLKPAEAFQKIRSGIVGMSRPLKDLGILIDDTTVKQWAINNAFGDGTGNLSMLEKVQVRYLVLLEQTKKAQGDMKRTLDSTTNVFRSLWSLIKETAIGIGNKLLPRVTEYARKMRDWLADNQKEVEDWAGVWIERLGKVIDKTWDWINLLLSPEWKKALDIAKNIFVTFLVTVVDLFVVTGMEAGKRFWDAFWSAPTKRDIMREYLEGTGRISKEPFEDSIKLRQDPKWMGEGQAGYYQEQEAIYVSRDEWGKAYIRLIDKQNKGLEDQLSLREKLKIIASAGVEKIKDTSKKIPTAPEIPLEAQVIGRSLTYSNQEIGPEGDVFQKTPETKTDFGMAEHLKKIQEQGGTIQALNERIANQRYETNLAVITKEMEAEQQLINVRDKAFNALDFEYDLLGKTNDERERAIEMANFQAELNDIENLSLERKNELMSEYESKLVRIQEKQASFSHNIQLWMNKQAQWGKNLAGIVTNAFESMSSTCADALMGMTQDWKALGRAVIHQLLQMIIQQQILFAWQLLTGTVGMGGGSGTGSGTYTNTGGGSFSFGGSSGGIGAPSAQHGGEVTQTGLIKAHKGEVFSGVNNEMGFGNTVVYIGDYAGVDIEVNEYKDSDQRIIDVSLRAAAGNGTYRRAHKIG